MECFLRAATLAPDSGEALMHLGVVLAALGHVDEAVTVHRRAVALRPDDPWTHTNLGLVLMEQGHPHEALAAQLRAVAVGPSVAEVHHNLGLAFQGVSAPDAAVECFERAHVLGLDNPRANAVRGHGLLGQNRFEEGVAAYLRASAGAPDDARWAIAAAIALPVIPASREAMAGARARLEANLDALRRSDLRVVDPDQPGGVGPSFYLTYHGLDDRDLQRKMAEVCLRANPSLAWTAPHCVAPSPPAGRRLRVGFVSRYLQAHSVGESDARPRRAALARSLRGHRVPRGRDDRRDLGRHRPKCRPGHPPPRASRRRPPADRRRDPRRALLSGHRDGVHDVSPRVRAARPGAMRDVGPSRHHRDPHHGLLPLERGPRAGRERGLLHGASPSALATSRLLLPAGGARGNAHARGPGDRGGCAALRVRAVALQAPPGLRRDPRRDLAPRPGRAARPHRGPVGPLEPGLARAVHPRLSRRERARARRAAAARRRVPGSAVHGRRPPRFDTLRRRHDLVRGPRASAPPS